MLGRDGRAILASHLSHVSASPGDKKALLRAYFPVLRGPRLRDPAHHLVAAYLLVPCAMFHTAARAPFVLFSAFVAARIRRHHETVPCGPPTDEWETRHPRRRKETVSPAGCASVKSALRRPPGPQSPGATHSWRPTACPTRGREEPGARSSAHPTRGPPRALAVPGLTFGALPPLASCCGCGAAGGRGEEERDSEWRSPLPASPPPSHPLTAARTSPCLD